MAEFIEVMEMILENVTEIAEVLFAVIGVLIIIVNFFKGLYYYLKNDKTSKFVLAEGYTMGLEFLMAGEILHTVIAKDLSSVIFVGAIVVVRVALTLLLHWEVQCEKKEEKEEREEAEKHLKQS